MDYNSLPNFYAALDAKYNVTNNELNSATYTNVDCNFVYSAKYARHRWFNYKEGFSPILVEKIFNEYKLNKSSVVCDPFCGAGTTVAVAKAKGMKSIVYGDPEHKVRIPSNMSIVGTMNTSDQNVFTLDTAFQRRWHIFCR